MDVLNRFFDISLKGLLTASRIIPYKAPSKVIYSNRGGFDTNYPFVFVLGFWSWGSYKKSSYETLPYFGFFTGENMALSMDRAGFRTAVADVSALGSAWDRACELYAQLTGTRVDYGRAHSEKFGHPRYGEDYTGRALIDKWDEENKINIICHSFGGPTSALFASLLAYGCDEEKAKTTDGTLSPLFEGGHDKLIHSVTGLAGAYNGTSLIIAKPAIDKTVEYLTDELPFGKKNPLALAGKAVGAFFDTVTAGDTPDPDTGLYDMIPENTKKLNETIKTVPGIYYFTVPVCTSKHSEKRDCEVPDMKITDYFFALTGLILGRTQTWENGGKNVDKTWQPNDGLVNTVSEYGPANAERVFTGLNPTVSDAEKIMPEKGRYYVFKTFSGSHNTLCGGTIRPCFKARYYIEDLMEMINSLSE